jgi:hypothetical protein
LQVKELEKKMETALKEGNALLEKAEPAEGDGAKKEDEEDKLNVKDEDKKQPAKVEEEDDMPDMPTLNLN